jgi:hypothetical protein
MDEEAPRRRSCGRQLRDERSRRLGVGPKCLRAAQALSEPRVYTSASTAPVVAGPGQTELPLTEVQVTLWSL